MTGRPFLVLVASPDDFFLEEAWKAECDALVEALGGAEVEFVPEDASAADVVMAVRSPSLFSENRVLVVRGAERWVVPPRKAKEAERRSGDDAGPLAELAGDGLPDGTALVLAALVPSKPSGTLADAVGGAGGLRWIPLPEPPKPWDEGELSREQRRVLEGILRRTAGATRFEREAVDLLFDRLGFAPRDLVREVEKLVSAVEAGRAVDEALVRRLVFPPERDLDVVLDALERGDVSPVLGLVAALEDGAVVRDWRGVRLTGSGLANAIVAKVGRLLGQMLYLRRLAVLEGLERDLDPAVNAERGWYPRRFKGEIGPMLVQRIVDDPGSPFPRRSASARPSVWYLQRIFRAAGRYSEAALIRILAGMGRAERASRGRVGALEAVTAWIGELVREGAGGRP